MLKEKKGWGLTNEILFLLVFVICLIIALVGLKKLNLIDSNHTDVTKPEPYDYTILEKKLVLSTKEYIKQEYDDKLGLDTLIIKANTLIKDNKLKGFLDEENNLCSGYTEVYLDENNSIIYRPYIKCGKHYETNGYVERKDTNE